MNKLFPFLLALGTIACSSDPASPPGPATQLAFLSAPVAVVAGAPFSVTVQARRADGSVDTGFTGDITVAVASGPGTLSGESTRPAVAGVAVFTDLRVSAEGSYVLAATSGSLTAGSSSTITSSPEPPQVRSGTFNGQNGYQCVGSVEVVIPSGGPEVLRTGSDFKVSSGGGSISIWLTNAAGAANLRTAMVKVKLGTITSGFQGVYMYPVPEGGSSAYTHVVAYCDGAQVNFGNAALSAAP